MAMILVGVSHKTAAVAVRERLSVAPAAVEKALAGFRSETPFSEMAILSTCNRTEIYGVGEPAAAEWARAYFSERLDGQAGSIYAKSDADAARHLFRVASGLDSLVLGENEILKQVKDAYQLAQKCGATGKLLNILFQRALYVGKLIRTHTGLSHGTVSVGSVAVALAEKIFGELAASTVLVFGAGKMAEVSARYLLSRKVKNILVANRTVENARALAEKIQAQPLSLEEGFERLALADIVITSIAAAEPVLSRVRVEALMARRQNRSLFLIDIAVPRNVEPGVHKLDNVYLYNMDDLQAIAQENLQTRSAEIERAERVVENKAGEFAEWYRTLQAGEERGLKHQPDAALQDERRALS